MFCGGLKFKKGPEILPDRFAIMLLFAPSADLKDLYLHGGDIVQKRLLKIAWNESNFHQFCEKTKFA